MDYSRNFETIRTILVLKSVYRIAQQPLKLAREFG